MDNQENSDQETLCGIFNLNGVKNQSKIKITHTENVNLKPHEYVGDTPVESVEIMKNVKGEIYKCNITHFFLLSSKKLPMMYISVIYERPLRRILLFRVYLCFTIESEVKSIKDLLNNPLDGHFSLEISIDNQRKEIDDKIPFYPGEEKICKKLVNFSTVDEMKELILDLVDEVNEKFRKEYEKEMEYYKMPTTTISLKDYPLDD